MNHLAFDRVPCRSKVPPSGFGYPLDGFSTGNPRKHFSFPRSWAFPFRAFFRTHDRSSLSEASSALTLFCKTNRLSSGAPAVYSRGPASLHTLQACLGPDGRFCSHGLLVSRVLAAEPPGNHFLFPAPSRSWIFSEKKNPNLRVAPLNRFRFSSIKRPRTRVTFLTDSLCHRFEHAKSQPIFSAGRDSSLQKQPASICDLPSLA